MTTAADQPQNVQDAALRLEETFDWLDFHPYHETADTVAVARVVLGLDVPQNMRDDTMGLGWA